MPPQFAQHLFAKHQTTRRWRIAGAVSLALLLWVLLLVGVPSRAQANRPYVFAAAETTSLTTRLRTSLQAEPLPVNPSDLLFSASSGGGWDARFGPPPAGLGANGNVSVLLTHPDGSIYATGEFTQVGSVAANGIAMWNPTTETWSALGSGLTIPSGSGTPSGVAMDVDANGNVYVAGRFDEAGGILVNNVAMWNPTTQQWSSLGTGVNVNVQALSVGGNGLVYIGGATTLVTAGGVTVRQTAQWNPVNQVWSPVGTVGTGGSGIVRNIFADKNSSRVYYVGSFTNFPGSSQSVSVGVAVWDANTSTWSALGQGVVREGESSTNVSNIYAGAVDADGNFYLGGQFTHAIQPNGNKIAANRIVKCGPNAS